MKYEPGRIYWVTVEEYLEIPTGTKVAFLGVDMERRVLFDMDVFPVANELAYDQWVLFLPNDLIECKLESVSSGKGVIRSKYQIPDDNRKCLAKIETAYRTSQDLKGENLFCCYDHVRKTWRTYSSELTVKISEWIELL